MRLVYVATSPIIQLCHSILILGNCGISKLKDCPVLSLSTSESEGSKAGLTHLIHKHFHPHCFNLNAKLGSKAYTVQVMFNSMNSFLMKIIINSFIVPIKCKPPVLKPRFRVSVTAFSIILAAFSFLRPYLKSIAAQHCCNWICYILSSYTSGGAMYRSKKSRSLAS